MKKIILVLLLLMLIGCSASKETKLNHDQLMLGDVSSIAGEYINSEGRVISLDAEDIKERLTSEVVYTDQKYYYLNVRTDDGMFGVGLHIYPVGVEVTTWSSQEGYFIMDTDTSKVRIYYGHDIPLSENEIYEKK